MPAVSSGSHTLAILSLILLGSFLAVPVIGDDGTDLAITLTHKGDLLAARGEYREALETYKAAVEADSYYSPAWFRQGVAFYELGWYNDAVTSFDRALSLDAYNTAAWVGKGDALANAGRQEEAIAAYDRALAVNPNELAALNGKGGCYRRLDREKDAIRAFEAVISISDREIRKRPNDARYDAGLWAERGEAYLALGRLDQADASFSQALSINPKHPGAIRGQKAVAALKEEQAGRTTTAVDGAAEMPAGNGATRTPLLPVIAASAAGIALVYAGRRRI